MKTDLRVNPAHDRMIGAVMEIVKHAAMQSMMTPNTDENRAEYVLEIAKETADIAKATADAVADAMINLIRTGMLSRLPLQPMPEGSAQENRWIWPLSFRSPATPAEDEPTR